MTSVAIKEKVDKDAKKVLAQFMSEFKYREDLKKRFLTMYDRIIFIQKRTKRVFHVNNQRLKILNLIWDRL